MIDFRRSTALFGGSFDPVHDGHLHIAKSLRERRPDIEQIVFVPTSHSPGKAPALASAEDRLRWLKLVTEPLGFLVWDEEILRGGESYTVDTLKAAHAHGAAKERLYWVVGGDAYVHFTHWRDPGTIRSLAQLIVVNRPGILLPAQSPGDVILEIVPHTASSSGIRAALAAEEQTIPYLPEPVRQDLTGLFLRSASPYVRKK
ncbi:MAG: nicotinate (nicotinamide) nucleotide adenylyltransferase [Bacteriovoracia bacterium]